MADLVAGTDYFNVNLSLRLVRHSCGVTYAVPWSADRYECPCCAARKREEIETWWRSAQDGNRDRDRTIAGLKGALARKRRA